MDSPQATRGLTLSTGSHVSESGIYRVSHSQHNLPAEVTLLRNQIFPRCSRCSEPVFYELIRSAPAAAIASPGAFTVALYELPEIAKDDESVA